MKIGLLGTSGSGKTTLAFRLAHELKAAGISIDAAFQEDRRWTFRKEHLDTDINTQYCFVLSQALLESWLMANPKVSVIITDQCVLVHYAYLELTFGKNNPIRSFVFDWLKTYDVLYYLPPRKGYVEDGVRPPKKLRDDADKLLCEW